MNTPQNDINRPPGGTGGQSAHGRGTGQAGDEAARLARQAKEEGKARIDDFRGTAADKVDQLTQGVKAAASELDQGGDLGDLSGHISDLAGGMARLSQGLREKSADELVRDVNRLARNNPALFLAGGVALGFTLTRLLRASTQAAGGHQDDEPHGGTERAADPFAAGSVTAGSAAGRAAPGSSTPGHWVSGSSTPGTSTPDATTSASRSSGPGGHFDDDGKQDTGRTP